MFLGIRGFALGSVEDSNGIRARFAANQAAISGFDGIADGGPDGAFALAGGECVTKLRVPEERAVFVIESGRGGFGFAHGFGVVNARGAEAGEDLGVSGGLGLAGIRNQRVRSDAYVSTLDLNFVLKAFPALWERFNTGIFLAVIGKSVCDGLLTCLFGCLASVRWQVFRASPEGFEGLESGFGGWGDVMRGLRLEVEAENRPGFAGQAIVSGDVLNAPREPDAQPLGSSVVLGQPTLGAALADSGEGGQVLEGGEGVVSGLVDVIAGEDFALNGGHQLPSGTDQALPGIREQRVTGLGGSSMGFVEHGGQIGAKLLEHRGKVGRIGLIFGQRIKIHDDPVWYAKKNGLKQ